MRLLCFNPQVHVLWDASIAIALSHVVESAGVVRRARVFADALSSWARFAGASYREEAIAHVFRSVGVSANVAWSASQGDCALRQNARGWAARGPTSNALARAVRPPVSSARVPVDDRPCFAYAELLAQVYRTQHVPLS